MKDKKDLINPEQINQDSLKKSVQKIKRNNDLVERRDEDIITEDGKTLLI